MKPCGAALSEAKPGHRDPEWTAGDRAADLNQGSLGTEDQIPVDKLPSWAGQLQSYWPPTLAYVVFLEFPDEPHPARPQHAAQDGDQFGVGCSGCYQRTHNLEQRRDQRSFGRTAAW